MGKPAVVVTALGSVREIDFERARNWLGSDATKAAQVRSRSFPCCGMLKFY